MSPEYNSHKQKMANKVFEFDLVKIDKVSTNTDENLSKLPFHRIKICQTPNTVIYDVVLRIF